MVVVTFRLALRSIDFLFVLHMKNVTGALFSGTSPKEMLALIKAYSNKAKLAGFKEGRDGDLDDAEAGRAGKSKKGSGCFGGGSKKSRERVYGENPPDSAYGDVRLHPEQELEFEQRAAWLVKIRAELELERKSLRHEIERASRARHSRSRDAQDAKSASASNSDSPNALSTLKSSSPAKEVHAGGILAPPSVPAPSAAPSSPARGASERTTSAPTSPVTPEAVAVETESAEDRRDLADLERLRAAKILEKRTSQLYGDRTALAKEIFAARKAQYEADRQQWMSERRLENERREGLLSDPNTATTLSSVSLKKPESEMNVEEKMRAARRDDGDFDGFSDAHVILIVRRFAKGVASYLFLAWFLRVWNADFTIFVAFSAVGALFVLISLREAALNVIGACVIIFYRAFVVGDWIKVESERMGGTPREGIVRDINFFYVTLTRVDDLTMIRVPNSVFLLRAVINVSRQHVFRHEFVLPIHIPSTGKGMDDARAFMNEAKRRVEAVRETKNVWVTLDQDPVGAGGAERRVRIRFDFEHGPQSPRNMNDPKPLHVAGIECRAWRAWLNFVVVRDDAMTAAIDAADGERVLLGSDPSPARQGGAGGQIRKLEVPFPDPGTNEGGHDAHFLATRKHEPMTAERAFAKAEADAAAKEAASGSGGNAKKKTRRPSPKSDPAVF
jgi:small-conductance mechanosensitive channel